MKKKTAKAAEYDEQSLLQEVLGHLQDVNSGIQKIEDFRDEIAAIRLDKELQTHPLTESVFEMLSDLRKRYLDARTFLVDSMGMFAGETELSLEE